MKITPGIIPMLMLVVIALAGIVWLLLPASPNHHIDARMMVCRSHLHGLGQTLLAYAVQNQNQWLAAEDWSDRLLAVDRRVEAFTCPKLKQARCSYGLNAAVAGRRLSAIRNPGRVVLLFETEGGWNLSGGPELLAKNDRHNGNLCFLFCDGHCERVRREDFGKLIWTPQIREETATAPSSLTAEKSKEERP